MTRLTISATGDPLTFRPVTSSINRKSKDGDVNVVILLFGSHYNISMDGVLQQTSEGDIDPNTSLIETNNGKLEMSLEKEVGEPNSASLIGTYSSFTYFYAGLKIRGHLELPITSHSLPVPELEMHYHYKDLLANDELIFKLVLEENNLRFDLIELVNDVETVLYTEQLGVGISEYYYEFDFLVKGKSKFWKLDNFETLTQTKTRKWLGDIKAKLGECNCSIHAHNSEETLRICKSDLMFLNYPEIFLKLDRTDEERFIGQIKYFDDMNSSDENDWSRVRSRDRKIIGNRVIENGMIRVIVLTNDPVIQIYGWNYEAVVPSWELVMEIMVEADGGSKSLKVQNLQIEFFNRTQIKVIANFGSSLYSFIMTRGDPYITFLNTEKLKFKLKTLFNRMGADFASGADDYNLVNTFIDGSPRVRALAEETLSGFTLKDNYFGFYTDTDDNAVVGWISNFQQPSEIKIEDINNELVYTFTYAKIGNIFGVGVLPSFPSNTVNGIPFPFVVGTQDQYIKWRANEALLSFKEIETIKRR